MKKKQNKTIEYPSKHAPYMLFILDEANVISNELYKNIENSILNSNLFRTIIKTSPKNISEKQNNARL